MLLSDLMIHSTLLLLSHNVVHASAWYSLHQWFIQYFVTVLVNDSFRVFGTLGVSDSLSKLGTLTLLGSLSIGVTIGAFGSLKC